jgi:hypothetical protein
MEIISKGIDISRWQGDFDLAKAKGEGFDFVIIKAGGGDDGLYTDSRFEKNYENAKGLGMPVGCYWFSKALTVDRAILEANTFYERCLKGKQFELPVYMDVEHEAMLDLGKRQLTDIIHAFCQRLEELGYWAGIYSSMGYFPHYMHDEELQRYAHWVACWGKECGYKGSAFGMWQYGGETNKIRSNKVAGVVCDQNYMLVDYPALIKKAGKNGFSAADEEPAAPEEPDVSDSDTEDAAPEIWVPEKCGTYVRVYSLAEDGEKYLTPHFQVKEFACKDGSDPVFIHDTIPAWCETARVINGPFEPNSTYRTVSHNAKKDVGGEERSYHLYGLAVDIPAKDATPQQLYDFFEDLLGDSCELGIYSWGVHVAVCSHKKRFVG